MILSEKSQASGGGAPWAELKSDKHLSADHQQNRDIRCRFTYRLQFWIMTGNFYSWDCSIFQYQTMCKFSVELGLVYKSCQHTLEKLFCCPGKTNCIHCSRNAGFFGKLNKIIFPSQPKTHFFRDILPEQVQAVQPDEARWWPRSRSWSCSGRCVHGRVLPGEMPVTSALSWISGLPATPRSPEPPAPPWYPDPLHPPGSLALRLRLRLLRHLLCRRWSPPGVGGHPSSMAPPSVSSTVGRHHGCGLGPAVLLLLRVSSSLAPPSFIASLVSVCRPPPGCPSSSWASSLVHARPSPLDFSTVRGRTFREGGNMSGLWTVFVMFCTPCVPSFSFMLLVSLIPGGSRFLPQLSCDIKPRSFS